MNGWRLWLAVIVVALVSAWAGYQVSRPRTEEPAVVAAASDTSSLLAAPMADLEGQPLTLQSWANKIRVVNFWATWCPPCREELPTLSALQKELGDARIQFVGVAIDDAAQVRAFLRTTPVSYPVVVAPASTLGLTAPLGNASQGLPFTLILDSQGRIVSSKLGMVNAEELRAGLANQISPGH